MKQLLTAVSILICTLIPSGVGAQIIEQDGVYYRLSPAEEEATVIKHDANKTLVQVEIPRYLNINMYRVTAIEEEAFKDCKKLQQITISNMVRSIGKQAFRSCTGLTEVTIPGTVTDLGDEAFLYCTNLKHVTIEDGVTTLSKNLFKNCYNLENVDLAASVTSIKTGAFESDKLKRFCFIGTHDIEVAGTPFLNVDLSQATLLVYSSFTASSYPWTSFGSIIRLDNLDQLVDGLYYNILNDEEAEVTSDKNSEYNILTGITKTHSYNLARYTIPKTITIGARTYRVKGIGTEAFYNYSYLKQITLPEGLEYINASAFQGCSQLESVEIPSTVTSIGNMAFRGCTAMTTATLKPSGTPLTIGDEVFRYCQSLVSVSLPERLTNLGERTFHACNVLPSITLPNSIKYINKESFRECSLLSNVTLPAALDSIGEQAFRDCQALKSITLPTTLKKVGREAFRYCTNITELTLPGSIRAMDRYAFANLGRLRCLTIKEGLSILGEEAFKGCGSLKNIYCYTSAIPSISDNTFPETLFQEDSKATLSVQPAMRDAFERHAVWGLFLIDELKTSNLIYRVDNTLYLSIPHFTGDVITPLAVPVKEGHAFSGWSTIPERMPGSNVIVNGYFKYNVWFAVDGSALSNSVYDYCGTEIELPKSTREHYHIEWTNPDVEDHKTYRIPAEDIVLEGHHVINSHYVYYHIDNANPEYPVRLSYTNKSINYGETLPAEPVAQDAGYIAEWEEHTLEMPDEDIHIHGRLIPVITKGDASFALDHQVGEEYRATLTKYQPATAAARYFVPDSVTHSIEGRTLVTAIGAQAFERSNQLTTVVLHDSIKAVGAKAFANCAQLTHVYHYGAPGYVADDAFEDSPVQSQGVLHVPADELEAFQAHPVWSQFSQVVPIALNTVTYQVDGVDYQIIPDVVELTPVPQIDTPEKEERPFSGWSEIPALMPDSAITISGGFQYVVTFRYKDEDVASAPYFFGKAIEEPAMPEITDSTFVWDNHPAVMPAGDFVIEGRYLPIEQTYNLTFKMEGADPIVIQLPEGANIQLPKVAERKDYDFVWDEHPTTMPAQALTISGHYVEHVETVVLDGVTYQVFMASHTAAVAANSQRADGGYQGFVEVLTAVQYEESIYPVNTIATGAFATSNAMTGLRLPASIAQMKSGAFDQCSQLTDIYFFATHLPTCADGAVAAGAFQQTALHVPADVLTSFSAAAPWNSCSDVSAIGTYTVSYFVNGEDYHQDQYQESDVITTPDAPVLEGHNFSGWGTVPARMGGSDLKVEGVFDYQLSFIFNDENILNDRLWFGSDIVVPEVPAREYYNIVWNEHPATMPAQDLTIRGSYQPKPVRQTIVSDGICYEVHLAKDFAYVVKPADVDEDGQVDAVYEGDITIPSAISHDGRVFRITKIADEAFKGCKKLKSITFQTTTLDSVIYYQPALDSIGKQAFRDCQLLTVIEFPASLRYIGQEAFRYCTGLTDLYQEQVEDPAPAILLGEGVFRNTNVQTQGTMHVSADWVSLFQADEQWNAFYRVTSIKYPNVSWMVDGKAVNVVQYRERKPITAEAEPTKEGRTFSGWSEIPELMPDHDIEITGGFTYQAIFYFEDQEAQQRTFYYGAAVTAPEITAREGYSAVWDELPATMPAADIVVNGHYVANKYTVTFVIDGLEQQQSFTYGMPIQLPQTSNIYGYVFRWESHPLLMPAHDVTIHGSHVERIEDYLYDGVNYRIYMVRKRAEVVALPEGLYSGQVSCVDEIVFDELRYPVTAIATSAFSGCKELTGLEVPEHLETIGKQAFRDCQKLYGLILPATIQEIGEEAFLYCNKLAIMTILANQAPTCGANAFKSSNVANAELHVPAVAYPTYTGEPWSLFGKIIAEMSSGLSVLRIGGQPVRAFYTLSGVRVEQPVRGLAYIVEMADGTRRQMVFK